VKASSARAAISTLAACAGLVSAPPALAGVANAGIPGAPPSNPIAGLPWGIYTGHIDGVYPAYQAATGEKRALMARIALRPRTTWFGPWISDTSAEETASEYIANVTQGNPNVLTQIAIFRVYPWEAAACTHAPSIAEEASYQSWIDGFAAGIGSAPVALILQPDLPFALCAPSHGARALSLVNYAAQVFAALPHTTVYIDVGAADWPTVNQAVSLLRAAGVVDARGFALNATHYDSNPSELQFGAAVSAGLARAGLRGKHFVINTAENGVPWKYWQYHGNHANPRVCRVKLDWPCMTLGVPPTTNVTSPRWGLPAAVKRIAARLCDGFLWIGRPWLFDGANPFLESQALQLARSTPFR
jgi:endoglucanase